MPFDLDSLTIVDRALHASNPLHAYETHRYPYPPGYFAVLLAVHELAAVSGAAFQLLIRIPPMFADLGLALAVQWVLGRRGAAAPERLRGAALIAFGPTFVGVSALQGQIDAVAVLPGFFAIAVWSQLAPGARRSALTGLLIGLGAAVKTVPILLLFAVLPSTLSWREAGLVVGAAVAVPALAILPFFLSDPASTAHELTYHGFPGQGGLSLLLQPSLGRGAVFGRTESLSGISVALLDYGWILILGGLAAAWRRIAAMPVDAFHAATLVWLTVYVFGGNFFVQYAVWVLPFLVVTGRWRSALVAQVLLIVPSLIIYDRPSASDAAATVYVVAMLALLAGSVAAWIRWRPLATDSPAAA